MFISYIVVNIFSSRIQHDLMLSVKNRSNTFQFLNLFLHNNNILDLDYEIKNKHSS